MRGAGVKMLGLIGGMSWESTIEYYRIINERVAALAGGLHSAPCLLWSFDFDEIAQLQHRDDWTTLTERMITAGTHLKTAGAETLVICTNTMHKLADEITSATGLPLVHIADATADAVRADGHRRIGLLGTRFTMEDTFYRSRMEREHDLEVLVPDEGGRETVHRVIYEELCHGRAVDESRDALRAIIGRLADAGAEGVILGCTELSLLVQQSHTTVPLYDTTLIHAEAAAEAAVA
jgi:aspartate racemase